MRHMKKKMKRQLMIPLCCFALTSLAILIMPFTASSETGMQQGLGYAAGILFWAGLVSGIITFIAVNRKNRKFIREQKEKGNLPAGRWFFRNQPAAVVDSLLIVSLTATIIIAAGASFGSVPEIIFLLVLVTTAYLHFLVNGNLFTYILLKEKAGKEVKENEKKEKF